MRRFLWIAGFLAIATRTVQRLRGVKPPEAAGSGEATWNPLDFSSSGGSDSA